MKERASFSWFFQTLKKHVLIYCELLVIAICIRLLALVEPFIFQTIIDRVLPFQRESTLLIVVVIFAIASVFQISFSVLNRYIGEITANSVTAELGQRLFSHLLKLPLPFYSKWPVGEILARLGETDTIRIFIVGAISGVFLDLLFTFIFLGAMLSISVELTWLVLISLPFHLVAYLGFGPFLRRRLREQFDASADYQSKAVEILSGALVVKSLAAEGRATNHLSEALISVLLGNFRVAMVKLSSSQVVFSIQRMLTIAIVFVGPVSFFAMK